MERIYGPRPSQKVSRGQTVRVLSGPARASAADVPVCASTHHPDVSLTASEVRPRADQPGRHPRIGDVPGLCEHDGRPRAQEVTLRRRSGLDEGRKDWK